MALMAAFGSIDITPPLGEPGTSSLADPGIRDIAGRLQARVCVLSDGRTTFCWFNSDGRQDRFLSNAIRFPVARRLNIPIEHTIYTSTHNHGNVKVKGRIDNQFPVSEIPTEEREEAPPSPFSPYEREVVRRLIELAQDTHTRLVPVRLKGAIGGNRHLTYNRKARDGAGRSYFMRESDRLRNPAWTGLTDPELPLVRVEDLAGRTLGFLVSATGHPITAFDPTRPRVHPDVTGVALAYLSSLYPGQNPIGLLFQGCAGDVNFKGMLAGISEAEAQGRELGRSLAEANAEAKPFNGDTLAFAAGTAHIPFASLPPAEQLQSELEEVEDFCRRARAGGPDTDRLLGYNFSPEIPVPYRENLASPYRDWLQWALGERRAGRARPAEELALPLQAFRVGDLVLVACGAELFVRIGLQIRQASRFPLTIVTGYANRVYGYLGASEDVGDGEYMSAFYRYTRFWPPFAAPAGDRVVDKAGELIAQLGARVSHG